MGQGLYIRVPEQLLSIRASHALAETERLHLSCILRSVVSGYRGPRCICNALVTLVRNFYCMYAGTLFYFLSFVLVKNDHA